MTKEVSIFFTCLLPGGCYGLWLLLSGASIIESDYLLLKRPPCRIRPASLSSSIVSSWPQGINLHATHKPPESPHPTWTVALLGIFLSLSWYINRSPTPNPPSGAVCDCLPVILWQIPNLLWRHRCATSCCFHPEADISSCCLHWLEPASFILH